MGSDGRSCRGMKKGGESSLGAALVACLSMEHITTGFYSQRWKKNRVPKSGQQEWVTGPEGGGKKGGDSYWREVRCLKWHACG